MLNLLMSLFHHDNQIDATVQVISGVTFIPNRYTGHTEGTFWTQWLPAAARCVVTSLV